MRKLLYLATFFIFTLAYLYSAGSVPDTITTGYVGLLQVSTTTIDPNRPAADKYNKNFQIISSSMQTLSSQISAIATDTTTINNRFNNVATDTTTLANRAPTIVIRDDGAFQGSVTAIDLTTNLVATVVGTTATITASGGGSAVENTTTTIQLVLPREVFIASNTACPIPGFCYSVNKGTFNVIGFDFEAEQGSTKTTGWTAFRIGITTYNAQAHTTSTSTYYTGDIHLSSSTRYSTYYSSAFLLPQDSIVSVHISSIPNSGLLPSGIHANIHGWWNKNTTW